METSNKTPISVVEDANHHDRIVSTSKGLELSKAEAGTSIVDTEETQLERWNEPRANAYRYFATLFAFIIMGMNDAAYGVGYPDFICCLPLLLLKSTSICQAYGMIDFKG